MKLIGFIPVVLLFVVPNLASCQGPGPVPAEIVAPIVDEEMPFLKQLDKKPICLTVDRRDPAAAVLEQLRKRNWNLVKGSVCYKDESGVILGLAAIASSDGLEVLAHVVDPRVEDDFATLLRETRYKFQRDSTRKWKLTSKTQTCCDEQPPRK